MNEPSLLNELHKKDSPLADRMRPQTLDEFVGQSHILAPGRLLRRCIESDKLSSLIFYGPPGTGKTTLAKIIANTTQSAFLMINAVLDGVKEIRTCIEQAKISQSMYNRRTILFVDEVHRFNKSQQDALLPHVENGLIIFIGATTENPYFEINKALISRSNIFSFQSMTAENLKEIAKQVFKDKERGYGQFNITITDDALDHLCETANGDARMLMNALELAVISSDIFPDKKFVIDKELIEDSMQKKSVLYDKDGDYHYDVISAFIKSLRGSDVDASLYWMAKMVYAGEDPRFIFRRMIILACEDIGMADPFALTHTVSAMQAFEFVGMPEGAYHLSSACIYLATCLKSNSSMAFFQAVKSVESEGTGEVPDHLKDGNRDKTGFGHGINYNYPHTYNEHFIPQQYLPDSLLGKVFYTPSTQGKEKIIKERVERIRELQLADFQNESSNALFQEKLFNNLVELKEQQRCVFFDLINTNKTPLVFVPYAERGWLAGEAVRRFPYGTFYFNCLNSKDTSILRHLLSSYLKQTDVQFHTEENPDKLLKQFAEQNILFDLIFWHVSQKSMIEHLFVDNNIRTIINENSQLYLMANKVERSSRLSDFLAEASIDCSVEELSLIKKAESAVIQTYEVCSTIESIPQYASFKLSERKSESFISFFTVSDAYLEKTMHGNSPFMQQLSYFSTEKQIRSIVARIKSLRHKNLKRTTITEYFRLIPN